MTCSSSESIDFLNDANLEDPDNDDNKFTIINTNARSLTPKIQSFIDNFHELDANVAIVTETWLADGPSLEADLDDLLLGTGIDLITRNRAPGVNGVCHGGVAIAALASNIKLKPHVFPNPDAHEILVATGAIVGQSRKVVAGRLYAEVEVMLVLAL